MDLSSLQPVKGAIKIRRRVGRGPGSGCGKTCSRGHKGQKSRSGGTVKPGFEGGQMPLQRRLPKRGFTNIFKKHYALISVTDLARFEAGSVVDPEKLIASGLVTRIGDGIKLLADGEIDKPITLRVHRWSQAALQKITAAGGTIEGV